MNIAFLAFFIIFEEVILLVCVLSTWLMSILTHVVERNLLSDIVSKVSRQCIIIVYVLTVGL